MEMQKLITAFGLENKRLLLSRLHPPLQVSGNMAERTNRVEEVKDGKAR